MRYFKSFKSFVKMSLLNRIKNKIRMFVSVFSKLKDYNLNPFQTSIIFDIGANDGSSFLDIAVFFPWVTIYAFEPTPYLIEILKKQSKKLKNYNIIPVAVSNQSGYAEFKIAGQGDWGCSSFLEFSDNLEYTWPDRTDFKVTEVVNVQTIRLDDFLIKNNINKIDLLHIDTQGTDLIVLQSLGELLNKVNSGVVEVPQSSKVMLYKNQHTKDEMINFLKNKNFEIWKITHQQNENNLYFRNLGKS